MNVKSFIFKKNSLFFLTILVFCFSCKDQNPEPEPEPPEPEIPEDILETSEPRALQYFIDEISKENKEFVVYSDFGDGKIRFTQKALLNPAGNNYPEMNEKAPSDYGVTCIHVTYPLTPLDWNGYMFITGRLEAGSKSPELDFGEHLTGYDLRDAKRLTFRARGKTGKEKIKFYIGGLGGNTEPFHDSDQIFLTGNNNGFITLSKDWKEYSMNLEGGADLSRIGCGFAWVTSQVENTELEVLEFDLDDIIYHFDTEHKTPIFLRSYESLPMEEPGAFINNFAYVYDNALMAIALAYAGHDSYSRQVADAIVYCVGNDRHYQPGPLRNTYVNGSPVSFPGWLSERNSEFAMLPGFYNTDLKVWYEDRYAVSINNGVMCWAIEALLAVYGKTNQSKYLESAICMADYIIDHFSTNDVIGGFKGGYEGWEEDPVKLTYKSTEHNIDLMSVFKRLSNIMRTTNPPEADKYLQASKNARKFILAMYNNDGYFYTGTLADGITPSVDNKPLDANTWAILTLYGDEEVKDKWDPEKVYTFIKETFTVGQGVDYNQDKDGIWVEGTAQLALAALRLGKIGEYNRIMRYLNSIAEQNGSIHSANRNGLTTGFDNTIATETGLDYIPWVYDHRISLGSTAWLAFAQLRINPYTGETLGN